MMDKMSMDMVNQEGTGMKMQVKKRMISQED